MKPHLLTSQWEIIFSANCWIISSSSPAFLTHGTSVGHNKDLALGKLNTKVTSHSFSAAVQFLNHITGLPRKRKCGSCKNQFMLRQAGVFHRVCLFMTSIALSRHFCQLPWHYKNKQAGLECYVNQLKKKIETKRWLSKKLGDKPIAQSAGSYCERWAT